MGTELSSRKKSLAGCCTTMAEGFPVFPALSSAIPKSGFVLSYSPILILPNLGIWGITLLPAYLTSPYLQSTNSAKHFCALRPLVRHAGFEFARPVAGNRQLRALAVFQTNIQGAPRE